MKSSPDLRPATAADIAAFTNGEMKMTCRAIVADLDGDILGMGGVYYTGSHVIAFSDFKDKMRKYPFTMARAVKIIMNIVGNKPCLAVADARHEGSDKLLEKIGFKHLDGRIYEWPIR